MTDTTKAALLLSALFLAACEPTEEQKQRVQDALPKGCKLFDLGKYGPIDRLVVVKCDGFSTVSASISDTEQQGKYSVTRQYLAVEVSP